uniref:MHC class I antigen n=1 Tax=Romanomermis culicivorax TaxID=13658 RepID=A0A915HYL7_ROMCU
MLARCRAGLVGGPFPIMRADQNRFYDKSSGIFIRCTANGALYFCLGQRNDTVEEPTWSRNRNSRRYDMVGETPHNR